MKLKITEPKTFKNIFENICNLTENIKLKINSQGMEFTCMDKAHISFTQVKFSNKMFEELPNKEEEVIINADEFRIMLSKLKENITLEFNKDHIILASETEEVKTQFKVQSFTEEVTEPVPPELEYPVYVTVPFIFVKKACDNILISSHNCFLRKTNDALIVESADNTHIQSKSVYTIRGNDEAEVKLSLGFFRNYLKFNKISDEISLGIGDDMPLSLKLENNHVKVEGLLAPRLRE